MSQNIMLVSWDSARADHLPFYGYGRDTAPHLEKIADDGLVFDRTYVSGVGTPTSFTGAFTGEHAHGVQTNISPKHWRKSNADRRFLQDALQDAGYYTGAVHANPLVGRHYGWNHGWDVFEDNLWTKSDEDKGSRNFGTKVGDGSKWWAGLKKTKILPALRRVGLAGHAIHAKNLITGDRAYAPWEQLWDDVESFIRSAPEPWFLWVLLVDTHHPWNAPQKFQEWPQPSVRPMHVYNYVMRRWPSLVGERNEMIVNAYDNELRHADAFMVELDELLDEEGLDPALVFHSDHGDELGEHDDYGHGPAMWDTVARVPLVIRNAGETGRRKGPHSLLNLGSTVLNLAGSDERLGGRPSLMDPNAAGPVHVENRTLDGRALRATVDGKHKIVDAPGADLEVYDLETDPMEQEPLSPDNRIVRLHENMSRPDPDDMSGGDADDMTDEVEERLTNLGYK